MKIAFFHNVPPGGARRVVYEEIKELSKKHAITLFTIKNITDDSEFTKASVHKKAMEDKQNFLDFTKLHCQIKEYSFSTDVILPGFLSRLEKDYKKFVTLKNIHKKIAKDIDNNNFSVVIIHPDQLTQAPFLLKFLKTKTIYYSEEWLRIAYENELQFKLHDLALPNYLYESFIRNIFKKIDKQNICSASTIIANSVYTANCIKKAYEKKTSVIYPGVSTDLFKMNNESKIKNYKNKKQVLFIGSPNESLNGYELLKNITPSLTKIGISIKIIDLFSHPMSEKELIKTYSSSLATLCLSKNEPFGLVPLESLGCETPVIAVNEGGYRETIINEKTGFLIQRDPNELLKKIIFLTKNKKLRESMGKNGRQHVIDNFSWKKHVELLEKYF